ncbi:hypothetical protein ACFL7M_00760 [Thermodesulfobacteriota bacterium]
MLRFQRVQVPPWELSVHPDSYIRLVGGYFSIAIDINPPSSSNVSGISWSILCREHIKTRKIRIGSWWKKLLKWTMIDILLIGLVIC